MNQRCQEQVGFVFKDPCNEAADAFCHSCRRPICRTHAQLDEQLFRCLSCSRQQLAERAQLSLETRLISDQSDPYGYSTTQHRRDFTADDRGYFDPTTEQNGEFEQDFDGS